MSKEARTVRPFDELHQIEQTFQDTNLHFGDLICPADSTITIDIEPHIYQLRRVTIEWSANDGGFELWKSQLLADCDGLAISITDLSIVIIARSAYLKSVDVVLNCPLSDLGRLDRITVLSEPHRPQAFSSGHHGCTVDAYVLLNRTIEHRLLRPWRKGTWLAHGTFTVFTNQGQSMFRPIPLDDEKRRSLGLSAKTFRYFHMGDHDPLQPYNDQPDKPSFYVDENLLAELNANPRTPAAVSLQLQLALDLVAAVIFEAARRPEVQRLSLDDLEMSLLGRILHVAAGPGARKGDRISLLQFVGTDPAKVVARAEHTIDIGKRILESAQSTYE